jgi:uncharacterized HAD superfamily protein
LPATLLACHLHLPLYATDENCVQPLDGGCRTGHLDNDPRRVLLVDDTLCSGRSMAAMRPVVREAFPAARLFTAAIYSTLELAHTLDFVGRDLPNPHYLEWNFFNSGFLATTAFDLDGIFCHDCPADADDDGPKYQEFIATAMPRYLPRRMKIPVVITARLEKYRQATLDWLSCNQVAVDRLVMGPWDNLDDRNRPGEVSLLKAQEYAASSLFLFVESDPRQAPVIADLSGKPVLCPAAGRVFLP